jgi:hypothetical protein
MNRTLLTGLLVALLAGVTLTPVANAGLLRDSPIIGPLLPTEEDCAGFVVLAFLCEELVPVIDDVDGLTEVVPTPEEVISAFCAEFDEENQADCEEALAEGDVFYFTGPLPTTCLGTVADQTCTTGLIAYVSGIATAALGAVQGAAGEVVGDCEDPECLLGNVQAIVLGDCEPGPDFPACVIGNIDAFLADLIAALAVNPQDVLDIIFPPDAPIVVAVAVTAPSDADQQEGTGATYTFTVSNDGDQEDTFDLVLNDEGSGWATLVGPASVTVAAGASADVDVDVVISLGDFPDAFVISLTATSQADDTVSDSGSFTVSSTEDAGGKVHVVIPNTNTVFTLDTTGLVAPTAGSASSTSFIVSLQDDNGFTDIDNDLLSVSLEGPETLMVVLTAADVSDDGGTFTRTFTFDLDFPAYLKDGTYTVVADYDGTELTDDFGVANVAPVLDGPAEATYVLGQVEKGPVLSDPVALNLDDDNWGAYDASSVVELDNVAFVVSFGGVPVDISSALVIQVDQGSGFASVPANGVLDLSLLSRVADPLDLDVRLDYNGDLVPIGTYLVTAQAFDDDGSGSAIVELFELEIRPENYGFFMEVDDGGDGVQSSATAAGQVATTSADPVEVSFTGTFAAESIEVNLGQFKRTSPASPAASFTAQNAKVLVYDQADLLDTPLEVNLVGGVASVDLNALGAAGNSVYLVFEYTVPLGTPAGSYSAVLDIVGTSAE